MIKNQLEFLDKTRQLLFSKQIIKIFRDWKGRKKSNKLSEKENDKKWKSIKRGGRKKRNQISTERFRLSAFRGEMIY